MASKAQNLCSVLVQVPIVHLFSTTIQPLNRPETNGLIHPLNLCLCKQVCQTSLRHVSTGLLQIIIFVLPFSTPHNLQY